MEIPSVRQISRIFGRHGTVLVLDVMIDMNSSCVDDGLQFEQIAGSNGLDTDETILSESRAPGVRASS